MAIPSGSSVGRKKGLGSYTIPSGSYLHPLRGGTEIGHLFYQHYTPKGFHDPLGSPRAAARAAPT